MSSQQRTKPTERTRRDDLALLQRHAAPYFGDTDITSTSSKASTRGTSVNGPDGAPLTVAGFVNWLTRRECLTREGTSSGRQLSPKTVANLVSLTSSVSEYATTDENPLISKNPFHKVDLPVRHDTDRPHLESAAYLALEKAVDTHFLPLLASS